MNVQIMSNNPAPTLCFSGGEITWHTYLIVFRVNPVSLTFCSFLKMFRRLPVRNASLACLLNGTLEVSPWHIFFLLFVSCLSITFLKNISTPFDFYNNFYQAFIPSKSHIIYLFVGFISIFPI